ncbi:hypothetical protein CENSYa_1109 [Cenarchaeum symbiosum A]|uniref:Uncharacterized protein n=1 Tax=Cenarchaeum symbiosum (strain A) TaxID=414004 RepID=A0RWM1_CENSY|nr:hypothetical protein CENSYa_1109 [Cenarchaeum symbiosum A]
MNVVPLFTERREALDLWNVTVRPWVDHTIRIRFVESGEKYWFIMAAESSNPDTNRSFYKVLSRSENQQRFRDGHEGEAYLRFGAYSKKYYADVKGDAICNCKHEKEDHAEEDHGCLYESCSCEKFESFQVNLLKKKKTVTDILFLDEGGVKDDPLAWNCLNANRYGRTG